MIDVRALRKRWNITQQELAEIAGCSHAMISRIEKSCERNEPMGGVSFTVACAIMDYFHYRVQREGWNGEAAEFVRMPNRACTGFGRDIWSFYCVEDVTERWYNFYRGADEYRKGLN